MEINSLLRFHSFAPLLGAFLQLFEGVKNGSL